MSSEIHQIRAALSYDPLTGAFTTKRPGKKRFGSQIGSLNAHGYAIINVKVEGVWRVCLAHRLAFVLMLGRWPIGQVDHANRDRADNRWVNLREATSSQNLANATRQANNTSGFRGVCWHKQDKRWYARIEVEGRKINLGHFDTAEEAAEAHTAAAIEHFGDRFRAEYLIEY